MKMAKFFRQMLVVWRYLFPSCFVVLKRMDIALSETFVIATKNGFFIVHESKCRKLLAGEYYGIAKVSNRRVFVFQKGLQKGRIWEIHFSKDYRIESKNIVITGLSHGIHQIDFYDDLLVIVDTYNNMIHQYKVLTGFVEFFRSKIINGNLDKGRFSDNYCHFNSVLVERDTISLLAHNETLKTGKKSMIWSLSKRSLQVMEKFRTDAGNAHNIFRADNGWILLDSLNNQVRIDDEKIIGFKDFIRGLSIVGDHALIGGSELVTRERRNSGHGSIYLVNLPTRTVVNRFPFSASIQEIRCLNKPDKCTGIYDIDSL